MSTKFQKTVSMFSQARTHLENSIEYATFSERLKLLAWCREMEILLVHFPHQEGPLPCSTCDGSQKGS